jgi:hypothetical protein
MNARPLAKQRVIAAVAPELERRIRAILPECELRFVRTRHELLDELDAGRCDMLIVGTHFDESTAMAAIERVVARDEAFPVVCIRGRPFRTALGKPTVDAFRTASGALGAENFIDLLEYPDDDAGNARVRAMLEGLLAA